MIASNRTAQPVNPLTTFAMRAALPSLAMVALLGAPLRHVFWLPLQRLAPSSCQKARSMIITWMDPAIA